MNIGKYREENARYEKIQRELDKSQKIFDIALIVAAFSAAGLMITL